MVISSRTTPGQPFPWNEQRKSPEVPGDLRYHWSLSSLAWSKPPLLNRKVVEGLRKKYERVNIYLKETVIQKGLLQPALFQGLNKIVGLAGPYCSFFLCSVSKMLRVKALRPTWTQKAMWWGEKHTGKKPAELSLCTGCKVCVCEIGCLVP